MINGYHWRWIVCLRNFLIILHDEYNDTCSCLLNLPLLLRLSPFVLWKGLHLVGKWQLHWWGAIACLYHMRSWSCVAFEKIQFTDFYCNRSPYFRSSQEFLLWILTKTSVNLRNWVGYKKPAFPWPGLAKVPAPKGAYYVLSSIGYA